MIRKKSSVGKKIMIQDNTNQVVFLEINEVIEYVLDIRNLVFKLEPNKIKKEPWNIVCFSERLS